MIRIVGLFNEPIAVMLKQWVSILDEIFKKDNNFQAYIVHFQSAHVITKFFKGHSFFYNELEAPHLLFSNSMINEVVKDIHEWDPLIVVADLSLKIPIDFFEKVRTNTIMERKIWVPVSYSNSGLPSDDFRVISFYKNDFQEFGIYDELQWYTIENKVLVKKFLDNGFILHRSLEKELVIASEMPSGINNFSVLKEKN